MDMASSSPTPTSMDSAHSIISNMSSMPASASSAAMDSGMDMGGGCKISMLWNWYTIDFCFISSTWRIRSSGVFAGSCIGVILLVMVLEALRRASREYDVWIVRQAAKRPYAPVTANLADGSSAEEGEKQVGLLPPDGDREKVGQGPRMFKPSLVQQIVRAGLHMCQFAVAYFVMLLAMYFNGYIIICIFIGAFLGALVFSWQKIAISGRVSFGNRRMDLC